MTAYPIPSGVRTPCADNPDLMFPTRKVAPKKVEEAKKVCGRCEFQVGCLEWALENDEEGVWSATDEDDRRAIHKRRGTVGVKPTLTGLVRHGTANNRIQHGTSVGVETHRRRYDPLCDICEEFVARRKGKEPPVPCPDCRKTVLPQSLRKHRRAHCPARMAVAS